MHATSHPTLSTTQGRGGEDILLDEFDALGLHCEPATQLVVTCEVCGRPATKQCWTCGMPICEFCTLKQHWKVGWEQEWVQVGALVDPARPEGDT